MTNPTVIVLSSAGDTGVKRVMQQHGEDDALRVAAVLHQGTPVPLDAGIALSAAQLGIAHKLPLADSIILATARQTGATIWTMEQDFAGLADVRLFPKKN